MLRFFYLVPFIWMAALFAYPSTTQAATLSNETTVTRWAYPNQKSPIYSRAGGYGSIVGYTRYKTEDGLPEIYVGLESKRVDGRTWYKIRIPKRPNGKTGWVSNNTLGPWNISRKQIVIDRRYRTLTLYKGNKRLMRTKIGIGTKSNPTPGGYFYVRSKLSKFKNAAYGPRVLVTSGYAPHLSEWSGGGVVGIHGTNQPNLIPKGRISHGCIRMYNKDVKKLYRLVDIGTPILIQ